MSAPAKARNPFDGLTQQQHDDAMRKLARVVDQAKTILGEPTPELAKQYLSPAAREQARSRD